MKKKTYILLAALATGLLADAAPPTFEKVPDAARTALKGSRGRPVRKGFVFVNGHYLAPPYTVARYGTAIFVNNVQMTDQIVPWKAFLATQPGNAPAAASAPSAPAKKTTEIDDLFDDDNSSAKAKPTSAKTEKTGGDEAFELNARANQLLKRINDYRTDVNRRLLNGETCFFGKGYPRVDVPQRLGNRLLNALPEAMRDATDGTDLCNRMRGQGFVFFTANLCADLIENRADYTALIERRRKVKEDEDLKKMLSTGAQGISL